MITVKNLEIKYDDFVAIDNISFNVNKGEFFTFLGPSGCGKTTTLRAIAGFKEPSKGTIYLDDKDITHVPVEKRNLGMIFQSYALFPTMTVYENIAYGLKIDKMKKEAIEERVHEMTRLVELNEEQLHKNVSDLSGGQQQRVAIARALAKKPDVVLFDEPLSNLDAQLRRQLRLELKRIQKETGMTAIYVTHDQDEALEISDRIAVFNNGTIEQIDRPREIYDHSETEFVCKFIGDANYLDEDVISYLNSQLASHQFDLDKHHYIREEKISLRRLSDEYLELPVKAVERIFQGNLSIYHYKFKDSILKVLVQEIGKTPKKDDDVILYIHPENILEYGVR